MRGFLFLLLVLTGCASQTSPAVNAGPLSWKITPGNQWDTWVWRGLFPLANKPQAALWAVDSQGKAITLYATAKAAQGGWLGSPAAGRPEALPVWSHSRDKKKIDTVTGATPGSPRELAIAPEDLPPGTYQIYFEVNKSFDFNPSYPEGAHNEVNGQPSLVYQGQLVIGSLPQTVVLNLAGAGSLEGTDGEIHPLMGIDTALNIVQKVEILYRGPGLPR